MNGNRLGKNTNLSFYVESMIWVQLTAFETKSAIFLKNHLWSQKIKLLRQDIVLSSLCAINTLEHIDG